MKSVLLLLAASLFLTDQQKKSKLDLLSQKWLQVGIKFQDKPYKAIPRSQADEYTIQKDGSFQVLVHPLSGNPIHYSGEWKFSKDSTKLAFLRTEMEGSTLTEKAIGQG